MMIKTRSNCFCFLHDPNRRLPLQRSRYPRMHNSCFVPKQRQLHHSTSGHEPFSSWDFIRLHIHTAAQFKARFVFLMHTAHVSYHAKSKCKMYNEKTEYVTPCYALPTGRKSGPQQYAARQTWSSDKTWGAEQMTRQDALLGWAGSPRRHTSSKWAIQAAWANKKHQECTNTVGTSPQHWRS